MFHCGLCAAVNLSWPGHLKICCTDVTASCTNSVAINVYVFVDVMLIIKKNTIFLNVFWQLNVILHGSYQKIFILGSSLVCSIFLCIFFVFCNLKTDKSPGLDSLHPWVLFEMRDILTYPLFLIYNKSLQSGVLPSECIVCYKCLCYCQISDSTVTFWEALSHKLSNSPSGSAV